MGPAFGTDEYKQQVEQIVQALSSVPMEPGELSGFLMLYILDESFSRAAICEAEKLIKRRWKSDDTGRC